MKCPHCNIELVLGLAIKPDPLFGVTTISPCQQIVNSKTLQLINVLKCPKCGYSDDGIDVRQYKER